MPTRVFLIRHGATELTDEDRFAGEVNVMLSASGCEQARLLGERLAQEPLAAVYASPLQRTMDTAAYVARPHALTVEKIAAMREIAHGHWEKMRRADVERMFAEEYRRWENDPYTFAPAGGESGLDVTARALPALLALVERHREKHFAIVSHKATIRLLLSSLLGFDPRRYRDRLDQSPAALNVLDFKDVAAPRLTLFNDVSHYAADPTRVPEVPHGRLSKVWGES
jgi:broad specificity phosphatase PhoE